MTAGNAKRVRCFDCLLKSALRKVAVPSLDTQNLQLGEVHSFIVHVVLTRKFAGASCLDMQNFATQ